MKAVKILQNIAASAANRASTLVEGQDTNIFKDPDSWWMINTAPWMGDIDSTSTDGYGSSIAKAIANIFA